MTDKTVSARYGRQYLSTRYCNWLTGRKQRVTVEGGKSSKVLTNQLVLIKHNSIMSHARHGGMWRKQYSEYAFKYAFNSAQPFAMVNDTPYMFIASTGVRDYDCSRLLLISLFSLYNKAEKHIHILIE